MPRNTELADSSGDEGRRGWLAKRRRVVEHRWDTKHAPTYDEEWSDIDSTHREIIERLLESLPVTSRILDAACGTGKYWPLILGRGHRVLGTDQSRGMLERARAKFPDIPTERVALQELGFHEEFQAALCIDSIQMVPPEDWPRVLGNLRDALVPGGGLYLTLEVADAEDLEAAYSNGRAMGLPIVPGEVTDHGGYHYHPSPDQVVAWLEGAGLSIDADVSGDNFLHYLVTWHPS